MWRAGRSARPASQSGLWPHSLRSLQVPELWLLTWGPRLTHPADEAPRALGPNALGLDPGLGRLESVRRTWEKQPPPTSVLILAASSGSAFSTERFGSSFPKSTALT